MHHPARTSRSRSRRIQQRYHSYQRINNIASSLITSINHLYHSPSLSQSSIIAEHEHGDDILPSITITTNNPNSNKSQATRRMNEYCIRSSRHYYHQVQADVRRHHMSCDDIRSSTVHDNNINKSQPMISNAATAAGTGGGTTKDVIDDTAIKINEYIPFDHYIGLQPSLSSKHGPPLSLIADQVALPEHAGCVPLLDVLPTEVRERYESFHMNIIKPENERKEASVRAMVHASHSEYIKLIRRMISADMLMLSDNKPYAINGMFGVHKDINEQRLILDARPSNEMMVDPPWFSLPTPDLLADIQVTQKEPLYVAKCDISNMFHQFAIPESWYLWFGMPPISSTELGMDELPRMIWPCCRTLAMGWAHSPYLAQTAHIHVAIKHGGLLAIDQLRIGNDLCMNRIRYMIFIDDISWIGHDRDEMIKQQVRYEAGTRIVKLPTKPSKRVTPTSTGVEIIGILLDGVHHTISLKPMKLHQLVIDTKALLKKGICSGHQLMQVMGRWTWASLVRRPTLSVMQACYWFAHRYYDHQHNITPSVKRELIIMCGLAPVLRTRLSMSYAPWIIATDASSIGQGVTTIPVIPMVQQQWQGSKHAIKYNQYIMGVNQMDEAVRDRAMRSSLQEEFASSMISSWLNEHQEGWSTIVSYRWKYHDQHINQLEARAVRTALQWASSRPISHQSKITMLTDSAVVYYGMKKGRSSSPSLSRALQIIAATLLANDMYLSIIWIPTSLNPSDAASRGQGGIPSHDL